MNLDFFLFNDLRKCRDINSFPAIEQERWIRKSSFRRTNKY